MGGDAYMRAVDALQARPIEPHAALPHLCHCHASKLDRAQRAEKDDPRSALRPVVRGLLPVDLELRPAFAVVRVIQL
jgi:hypothetical protein